MDIILATTNPGKIQEFKDKFHNYNINFKSLADIGFDEEIEENGNTFLHNALIKAKVIYEKYHLPTLADDSGLCVRALNYEPGIYSARYHGLQTAKERRLEVLKLMEGKTERQAYFYCGLVYIDEDGVVTSFEGQINGYIGYEEKGENGFGYDPIFYLENGLSFAEISLEEKNKISHRAIAIKKFEDYLWS